MIIYAPISEPPAIVFRETMTEQDKIAHELVREMRKPFPNKSKCSLLGARWWVMEREKWEHEK